MSLLIWDRPLGRRRRDIAAQQDAVPSVLTPLRMTLVGALLIAVGPLSISLYTPAMGGLAVIAYLAANWRRFGSSPTQA